MSAKGKEVRREKKNTFFWLKEIVIRPLCGFTHFCGRAPSPAYINMWVADTRSYNLNQSIWNRKTGRAKTVISLLCKQSENPNRERENCVPSYDAEIELRVSTAKKEIRFWGFMTLLKSIVRKARLDRSIINHWNSV